MKKVLLPTDFSENAYNAIRYAQELYKDDSCLFYLLHTYSPPIYYMEYAFSSEQIGMDDFYQTNAVEQLEELKKELEKSFKNPLHQFRVKAAFNTLVDEILEMVENEGINIIVMGTKGATGAKELLFGSNTVHVMKKTKCPVIAVPDGFAYETPKEILFPTDYEISYRTKALKELLYLANEHISRIDVLHVATGRALTDVQVANKEKLEKLLKPFANVFYDMPNNEVINGINEFQLKNKVNLLVMIMNKHTFLERLFLKPVIKKIGLKLYIPFMVIPYPN
ncbi:universal stress protein [Flagellimonas sp.]|uniref:universal stress protein n=1 Tax=Flagellimonas sp. TaxID=2058762 RepID=UPI003B4FFBF9